MDASSSTHRQSAALERMRNSFIDGEPGALLCVEIYAIARGAAAPLQALEADLRAHGMGYRYTHASTWRNRPDLEPARGGASACRWR
jgi:hypothetical protein